MVVLESQVSQCFSPYSQVTGVPGTYVDGGVGTHQEPGRLRRLDAFDRLLEHAVPLDRRVVRFLQAVQMDVEEEPAGRPELVELLDGIMAKADNEKVLVFSQWTSLLDLCEVEISGKGWGYRRYGYWRPRPVRIRRGIDPASAWPGASCWPCRGRGPGWPHGARL